MTPNFIYMKFSGRKEKKNHFQNNKIGAEGKKNSKLQNFFLFVHFGH